jgi:hypothetical protein
MKPTKNNLNLQKSRKNILILQITMRPLANKNFYRWDKIKSSNRLLEVTQCQVLTEPFLPKNPKCLPKSFKSKKSWPNSEMNRLVMSFLHFKLENSNLTQWIRPFRIIDILKCPNWRWIMKWERNLKRKWLMLLQRRMKSSCKELINNNNFLGSWRVKKTIFWIH